VAAEQWRRSHLFVSLLFKSMQERLKVSILEFNYGRKQGESHQLRFALFLFRDLISDWCNLVFGANFEWIWSLGNGLNGICLGRWEAHRG